MMPKSEKLTYKTQGDATRVSHYCTTSCKDALTQRLGEYEEIGLSPAEVKALARESKKLAENTIASYPHIRVLIDMVSGEPIYRLWCLNMNTGPYIAYGSKDLQKVLDYAKEHEDDPEIRFKVYHLRERDKADD
jgi:hypothetical protein